MIFTIKGRCRRAVFWYTEANMKIHENDYFVAERRLYLRSKRLNISLSVLFPNVSDGVINPVRRMRVAY
jgi:hypothetical protein